MSRILVTGGAGFIGSHCVDQLVNAGHSVIVLDKDNSRGNLPEPSQNLEIVMGGIEDQELVDRLVSKSDGIIHLAAQVSVPISIQQPIGSANTNIIGFLNILEAARKHDKPVVYASSAAVYGKPSNAAVVEEDAGEPLSPYGLEKYIDDQYANLYAKLHNLKITGLRFFNVYGPRQDPSSQYSGVLSIFVNKLLNEEPLVIFGDGEQTRDFIFVQDVAETLILALNSQPGGVMNVATGNSISLNEIVSLLGQIIDIEPEVEYQEARPGDIRHSSANNSKLIRLRSNPFTDIRAGLEKYISSVRTN